MNRTQRIILAVTATLVLVTGAYWATAGFHIFTQTEIPVEQVDELFGTKTIVWQKSFVPGFDLAGPVMCALLAIGAVAMFLTRTRRIKPSSQP
jgi:hypothetical protein